LNDPSLKNGPFWKFLRECQKQGVGNINKDNIKKVEFDVRNNSTGA